MKFKQVEPIQHIGLHAGLFTNRLGRWVRIPNDDSGALLTYTEARALRDWLNAALGEDGYVRVPMEPTSQMQGAAIRAWMGEPNDSHECDYRFVSELYRAMLSAAPSTSAQEGT